MRFMIGRAMGVLSGTDVHVLKASRSSFGLFIDGEPRRSYCCQDGCCDCGLQEDVREVVAQAKGAGAERVVIRTGQQGYYWSEIEGLPVSDVSEHVGKPQEGYVIRRG